MHCTITTPYHTILYHSMPYYTIQHRTIEHNMQHLQQGCYFLPRFNIDRFFLGSSYTMQFFLQLATQFLPREM